MKNRSISLLIRLSIILLAILIVYTMMKISPVWAPLLDTIRAVSFPFMIAALITYLLHPLVERLHQQGLSRTIAIAFIYILFFVVTGFAIYKGIPLLVLQLKDLSTSLPQFMDTYRGWISELHEKTERFPPVIHDRFETGLKAMEDYISQAITGSLSLIKSLFNSIILFAIVPFLVFYLLKDITEVKKAAWFLTPKKWRNFCQGLLKDIDKSLGNYIRGQFFVCTAIGLIAWISLWLVNMKYSLLLGMIIGMTNIIPYFGPLFAAIPTVILAATVSLKMVVIVLLIIFGLQFIEGNLLSPLIVGKSLHMHPVIIIFALLLGGEIGGVLGLVFAVPIIAVLKVIITHARISLAKH